MQFGQCNFSSRTLGFVFVVKFDGGGNAAAVINNAHGVVHVNCDEDIFGIAGHGFVDGIVHHLIDEMVQTGAVGDVADIHAGAFPYGFQTFKDFDVGLVISGRRIAGCVFFRRFHSSHKIFTRRIKSFFPAAVMSLAPVCSSEKMLLRYALRQCS